MHICCQKFDITQNMLKKFNVNMYDFKNKAVEADDDDFVIIQVTPAL